MRPASSRSRKAMRSTVPGSEAAVTLPPRDGDGFLCDSAHWDRAVAEALAAEEGIVLGDAHWEILALLRRYYSTFDSSPAMRALVKYCRQELGADKGTSLYLLTLF